MVADWHDGFVLRSVWTPNESGGQYRLILGNRGTTPIEGFRLGVSGPARINEEATIGNGRIVTQLSNYAELAPPAGFVLAPGAEWVVDIDRLDYPLRHWTDGATTGFVILADGRAVPAVTLPTERADSAALPARHHAAQTGAAGVAVAITPWPNHIEVGGRRTPPQGLAVATNGDAVAAAALAAFGELVDLLFPGEGLLRGAARGRPRVMPRPRRRPRPRSLPHRLFEPGRDARGGDADRLSLWPHHPRADGRAAPGARAHEFSFPTQAGSRTRRPWAFAAAISTSRGVSTASPRSRRFLALLAWNKLNRFHWHLSDDEAWRVEIEAYPRLTEIGAWRGYGLPLPPLLGSGPGTIGRLLQEGRRSARSSALAGRFGIEVIPEIDVPGHCYALLQALPELRDAARERRTITRSRAFPTTASTRRSRRSMGRSRRSSAKCSSCSPSRWFHLGADEVPAAAWDSSAAANAMRERLGVSGAAPLQAAFLRRIQAFLTAQGRITGAWEEAAHGGGIDKANTAISWAGSMSKAARSSPPRAMTSSSRPARPFISTWPTAPTGTSRVPAGPAGRRRKRPTGSIPRRAGARPKRHNSSASRPASGPNR